MSKGTARTPRQKEEIPSIDFVAQVIGSALYVAQSGGLIVEVKPFSGFLSIRIGSLTAIDDNGELQIVPVRDANEAPVPMPVQGSDSMPVRIQTGNSESDSADPNEHTEVKDGLVAS